jgi:hypothetical protein
VEAAVDEPPLLAAFHPAATVPVEVPLVVEAAVDEPPLLAAFHPAATVPVEVPLVVEAAVDEPPLLAAFHPAATVPVEVPLAVEEAVDEPPLLAAFHPAATVPVEVPLVVEEAVDEPPLLAAFHPAATVPVEVPLVVEAAVEEPPLLAWFHPAERSFVDGVAAFSPLVKWDLATCMTVTWLVGRCETEAECSTATDISVRPSNGSKKLRALVARLGALVRLVFLKNRMFLIPVHGGYFFGSDSSLLSFTMVKPKTSKPCAG